MNAVFVKNSPTVHKFSYRSGKKLTIKGDTLVMYENHQQEKIGTIISCFIFAYHLYLFFFVITLTIL